MGIRQVIDANNFNAPLPFMKTSQGVTLLAGQDSIVFDENFDTYVRVVGKTTSKIGWNLPDDLLNSDCNWDIPAGSITPIILPKGQKIRCLSGEVNITPSW